MIAEKPSDTHDNLIRDKVSGDTNCSFRNEFATKPGNNMPRNMIGYISALNHIHCLVSLSSYAAYSTHDAYHASEPCSVVVAVFVAKLSLTLIHT